MLERFQVPAEDRVYVKEPKAREATEKIFLKMGLSKVDATLSADVLMYADINGVDTHGVSNMLRMYVRQYGAKELNPRAKPKVVRDSMAAATVDGDRGLGLHVAPQLQAGVSEVNDVPAAAPRPLDPAIGSRRDA
jgi:LDH2 family malate/lactate/ureidoglycolate dehydrogenase